MKYSIRFFQIFILSLMLTQWVQGLSLVAGQQSHQNKPSEMTRAYMHPGNLGDKLVFLFSGNPVCTYIPKNVTEEALKNGEPVQLSFMVPLAKIKNKTMKDTIKNMNNLSCHEDYCLVIKHVETPIKGIEFSITLAPEKRALEYQSFTSITGEKGIVFKFFDQKALKNLNLKTANVIRRYAYAKKPKVIVDFGHGGDDPGYIKGDLKEKEINRAVGQELVSLLKKKGIRSA